MEAKLYKKHYLIGIYPCYGEDDLPLAILSNTSEFAEFFGITNHDATVRLNKFFKNKNRFLRFRGKLYEVYFIDNNEEED